MSAPLFLVDELPTGTRFTLTGAEGHHAADVQRIRAGEELILGDGRGGLVRATVTGAGRGSLELALGERTARTPYDPRLVVVQGIAKGDRGELAVQAMTEAGVDEIVPWAAARSVAQWRGDRGVKARDKWVTTAREAAKQARRAWLPVIGGDPDASTKEVANRIEHTTAFVLHEDATDRLTTADLPGSGEIVLIIGPEGGIADAELDALNSARKVRLGTEVLRTSTAGVAALAVLAARLQRW
jgi:16S rRNA (uracil1498-N3)-methyltransferase